MAGLAITTVGVLPAIAVVTTVVATILETVVQVLVADDIGRETITPVGVTEPVVADTFSDIVMGCDNPGNDTCRTTNSTVVFHLLGHM